MSTITLYESTPQTGTVSSTNSTSLYSNTSNFTTGIVNTNVSSVTGGTGVTVNPTTGNVVVSIGQPVAVTDNPTFAGATLGNITVGLTNDQIINSITGDLNIKAQNGAQTVVVTGQFFNDNTDPTTGGSYFIRGTANTNSIVESLGLYSYSTGTVTPGFGTELVFYSELSNGIGYSAGSVQLQSTNVTLGSETYNMNFKVKNAGVFTERMVLDNLGNLQIDNDLTVSGGTVTLAGSTSGTVALNAPAIAGTQSYTLPTAVPAVNGYVLSSTTGGVMSWAATAPGAGDVVGPASATDNAVVRFDTTTGKLIQNSTVTIDDSGNIVTNGDIAVNGGDITTTAATFNLINTTATTLNIGAAATTVNIGAVNSGTTIINNTTLSLPATNGANILIAGRANLISRRFDTTTTTPNQVFVSNPASSYRNSKYQVSIVSGSDYHSADVTLTNNGTTSFITVSNEMWTNVSLTDWDTDISGGNVRLLVSPTNAVTTYRALNTQVI